jgi:hypothetical protein
MPLHHYRSYNFRYVLHMGFHELPLSDASQHAIYARDIMQILGELIASVYYLDMFIELRLTVPDDSELISEANRRGDTSVTKSVEVHFNQFIPELDGYQSWHQ